MDFIVQFLDKYNLPWLLLAVLFWTGLATGIEIIALKLQFLTHHQDKWTIPEGRDTCLNNGLPKSCIITLKAAYYSGNAAFHPQKPHFAPEKPHYDN